MVLQEVSKNYFFAYLFYKKLDNAESLSNPQSHFLSNWMVEFVDRNNIDSMGYVFSKVVKHSFAKNFQNIACNFPEIWYLSFCKIIDETIFPSNA